MLHKFRVAPKEEDSKFYDISIDGMPVRGVTDINISLSTDSVPMIRMTLMAENVDAETIGVLTAARISGDAHLARRFDATKCTGLGFDACERCDMPCPYR